MLGLTLLFPRLKALQAFASPLAQKLWESFCAALAVQLGLIFPQLYWFGQLPLLALLLNPFVILLFSGLLALYWLVLASLPVPGLREGLGFIAAHATKILLDALQWLQQLPVTTLWTRQADVFTFCGWVLLLLAASGLLPRQMRPHRHKLLALSAALIALILLPLPRNDTRYIQFSVGNADAAVLLDQDMTVVIDTGEDGVDIAGYLQQQRRRVDAMFITHLHTDHALGIMAFLNQGVPVDVCYLPADAQTPIIDEETLPVLEALQASGTELRYLSRGDTVEIPSGLITVLWPVAGQVRPQQDANDACLILQAEIAGVTMLLTGDLSSSYAAYSALPADILKAPHHGSKIANSAALLDAVQPQLILQSNRLESRSLHMAELAGDIPLINTDEHGAAIIHFTGDGQFTVETCK
jgi:competence protein ComEC